MILNKIKDQSLVSNLTFLSSNLLAGNTAFSNSNLMAGFTAFLSPDLWLGSPLFQLYSNIIICNLYKIIAYYIINITYFIIIINSFHIFLGGYYYQSFVQKEVGENRLYCKNSYLTIFQAFQNFCINIINNNLYYLFIKIS